MSEPIDLPAEREARTNASESAAIRSGHTSEINPFTDYDASDMRTHPQIQRSRLETLDDWRPEPEPHVCIFQTKGCCNEKLCFHCQKMLNETLSDEEKSVRQKHAGIYTARADRLNRESPAALVADTEFWDSLSSREKDYVMRHMPKPKCVPCFPLLSPQQYIWLQKAANKIGGGDADEKMLAEWAVEGLERRTGEDSSYEESQKIGTPITVPGPPAIGSGPLPY